MPSVDRAGGSPAGALRLDQRSGTLPQTSPDAATGGRDHGPAGDGSLTYQLPYDGSDAYDYLNEDRDSRNVIQRRAGLAARRAVKTGLLIKPTHCEKCGKAARLYGHHWNYNRPLDVIWVCVTCHKLIHPCTQAFAPRQIAPSLVTATADDMADAMARARS